MGSSPWWLRLLSHFGPDADHPPFPQAYERVGDDPSETVAVLTEDATACAAELAASRRRIVELEQLVAEQREERQRLVDQLDGGPDMATLLKRIDDLEALNAQLKLADGTQADLRRARDHSAALELRLAVAEGRPRGYPWDRRTGRSIAIRRRT